MSVTSTLVREPLQWYVNKLVRCEPFTSLLYGDGEFLVCMRERTGQRLAYGEVVTKDLEDWMEASLLCTDRDIVRGTDLNLIDYTNYRGRDYNSVASYGERINAYLGKFSNHLTFHDGTVWEFASREGTLAPLLRALKGRSVLMVANRRLRGIRAVRPESFVEIPDHNAYASLESIRAKVLAHDEPDVCIVCTGLGAIPLIMALRTQWPNCTYLDLGSTFDLFARLPSRGWREHLYRDEAEYQRIINANLEGV